MEQKRGKLIVLESGEGGGKGENVRHLKEVYKDRDDIIFTREPGGSEAAEDIRAVILNKKHKGMEPLTEFFLFYGSRAEHVAKKIKPAIRSGKHVICERACPSTFAYQVVGREREHFRDAVMHMSALVWEVSAADILAGKPIFDAIIYLDVPPEIGLMRAEKREGSLDRIELEGLKFHTRVREGYLKMCSENFFGPWYKIDATRPLAEVKLEVQKIVSEILAKP